MKKLRLRIVILMALRRLILLLAVVSSAGAIAQEVIPDFYRDPGIYPERSYVNQNFNEYIDPFTGSLQLHYVDFHIPGNAGFDLKVVRSYNSASVDPYSPTSFESLAGLGWTIHFGRVLKTMDTAICSIGIAATVANNPVLELPDGSRQLFVSAGGSSPLMLTTQRWRADCLSPGIGLAVYSPDGTRYDMNQRVNVSTTGVKDVYAWYTTKITDRNGNYATISYANSSSPQITSITTNDGRSISFSYADSGLNTRRITSISSAGKTYNYNYQTAPGAAGKYFLTSVVRPDGTSWQYSYNGYSAYLDSAAGNYVMSQMVYPQGGSISYGYSFVYFDQQANPSVRSAAVTSKTLSTGGAWSFSYTPGRLNDYDTTVVNTPSGGITYRHIGSNYSSSGTVWMVGLLMSKTTGNAQTETYTWGKQKISSQNYFRPGTFVTKVDVGETNAPVLMQRVISRNGATYTTNYSNFDGYGNPGTVSETGTSGGSRTTNISYYINASKWIINQPQNESFSGSSISRSFDNNGNLLSITRDGITTSYTYDSQGNVTSVIFPRSLNHSYSNYKRGIAQNEIQPEGIAISRAVSDAGNITSETNGDGRTTNYSYDAMNRLTSVQPPAGNSISISYTATTKRSTRGGLTQEIVYNGFDYPTRYTLGGIVKNYTVDALGRRTFESDPNSSQGTIYGYDILDRVISTRNADGSSRTMSYGAGTKTVGDERGNATTYSYRSYGDPARQILMGISAPESSASVTLARNSVDLVTSVSQGGQTRGYGYNANYYLTSASNPETGSTAYGRDAAGNMTSKRIGSSTTVYYAYDGQNRLSAVSYSDSTPGISYTYNRTHKMLSARSSGGSRTFTYDGNNNLLSDSLAVDNYQFVIKYAYNGNDILSSMTYPISQRVVGYSPDTLGRPTQVSGYVTSVTYWPSGQIKDITYANGVTTSYGQNNRLWPSSVVLRGASTYINSNYSYDNTGNVTGISDAIDSSYARTLAYDRINRLTTANGSWGAGGMTYDGAGNITQQRLGSSSLNYSYSANRLSSVSGALSSSFTYDAQGDIIAGFGNTYTYDSAPNLRCFNCSNASAKIEYGYDGINHRSSVLKAGVLSYEMHDLGGNQIIEFMPAPSNKLTEYIYLAGKRIAQQQ